MRTSAKKVNPALKKRLVEILEQVIADLKNYDEVKIFLSDFMTDSEIEAFTKRLAVAYWLKKGRSYSNIKTNLKVSSATIASIQASLGLPGYQLALKKIEAEEWAQRWSKKFKKIVGQK